MSAPDEVNTLLTDPDRFGLRWVEVSWWACLCTAVCSGVLVVGLVVYCVAHRLTYPFELEWMEGAIVDHARRILAGQPLYAPPSADFMALVYTPMHACLAAGLMWLGLDGFLATRLIAVGGIVGATLTGLWLVARGTRHKLLCLFVPALVAAAYFDADEFYDVGRYDSLLACFCVLAVAGLTLRTPAAAFVTFVLSAWAAFFTKQSCLLFLATLLVGLAFLRWRLAVCCAVGLGAALLATIGWADHVTQGWFWFYLFELTSYHRARVVSLAHAVTRGFCGAYALPTTAVLLAAVTMLLTRQRTRPSSTTTQRTYTVVLLATLAAGAYGLASRANIGGAENVLIPYAVLSAAFLPLALSHAIDRVGSVPVRAVAWRLAMLVLCVAMLRGVRTPYPYVPQQADVAAWGRLQDTLSGYGPPERLWLPGHGAARVAGRRLPVRPHVAALAEYLGGFGRPTGRALPADLAGLVRQRYFKAILVSEQDQATQLLLQPYYQRDAACPPIYLPEFSPPARMAEQIWVPTTAAPS